MGKLNLQTKFLSGFIILLFLNIVAFSAYGKENKNCSELEKTKVEDVLKKINVPSPVILSIKQSPLAGLCEIGAEIKGAVYVLYADHSLEHVLFGSNLIETKARINLTAKSVQEIQDSKRIDVSKIYLNEAFVIGDKGAAKKVIVFTDPD